MLHFFQRKKAYSPEQTHTIYQMIVRQIRDKWFYTSLEIEGTPLGRFEIMTVHLFIVLRRLKEEKNPTAREIAQSIIDLFVVDLDHSLRDLKISETRLAKQFNRFIQGFYGRLIAYDKGLEEGRSALEHVIHKNLLGSQERKEDVTDLICNYIEEQLFFLKQQPLELLKFKDIL